VSPSPSTVSNEAYYSVKRDLVQCQKRPTPVSPRERKMAVSDKISFHKESGQGQVSPSSSPIQQHLGEGGVGGGGGGGGDSAAGVESEVVWGGDDGGFISAGAGSRASVPTPSLPLIFVYVYMYICIYVCMAVCVRVLVCVCVCVCVLYICIDYIDNNIIYTFNQ
jgi:hypothetical protein